MNIIKYFQGLSASSKMISGIIFLTLLILIFKYISHLVEFSISKLLQKRNEIVFPQQYKKTGAAGSTAPAMIR